MRLSYSSCFLALTTGSTPLCQVIPERIPEEIRFPQQKLLNNDSLATAGSARITSGARIAGVAVVPLLPVFPVLPWFPVFPCGPTGPVQDAIPSANTSKLATIRDFMRILPGLHSTQNCLVPG